MPEGLEGISVEQQNFVPEHSEGGIRYFRAPAHFEKRIIGMGLGIKSVKVPPANAPDDLPEIISSNSEEVTALKAQVAELNKQLYETRTENSAAMAALGAAKHELEQKTLELHEVTAKWGNFLNDLKERKVRIPDELLEELES